PRASAGVRRFLPRADDCPAHLALAGLARVPRRWSSALLTRTMAGHPRSDLDRGHLCAGSAGRPHSLRSPLPLPSLLSLDRRLLGIFARCTAVLGGRLYPPESAVPGSQESVSLARD